MVDGKTPDDIWSKFMASRLEDRRLRLAYLSIQMEMIEGERGKV
jgi:hypothetical protein